jgi:hypothetical protein
LFLFFFGLVFGFGSFYRSNLLVVIPFFNEEPEDLYRTIVSTYENGQFVYGSKIKAKKSEIVAAVHAVIILDGILFPFSRNGVNCRV